MILTDVYNLRIHQDIKESDKVGKSKTRNDFAAHSEA